MVAIYWNSILGGELWVACDEVAKVQEAWHSARSAHSGRAAEKRVDLAIDRVERLAKRLGFAVIWPGLHPVFRDADGGLHYVPECQMTGPLLGGST